MTSLHHDNLASLHLALVGYRMSAIILATMRYWDVTAMRHVMPLHGIAFGPMDVQHRVYTPGVILAHFLSVPFFVRMTSLGNHIQGLSGGALSSAILHGLLAEKLLDFTQ